MLVSNNISAYRSSMSENEAWNWFDKTVTRLWLFEKSIVVSCKLSIEESVDESERYITNMVINNVVSNAAIFLN